MPQKVPNHRIPSHSLLEIIYRVLNANNKDTSKTIIVGLFISLKWDQALIST